MAVSSVDQIIDLIEKLPDEDRLTLEKRLAEKLDRQWNEVVQQNRRIAAERGIDDAAIDAAIHRRRYGA